MSTSLAPLRIENVTDKGMMRANLDAVARLRISVFRAYPYLYDGTETYEKKYLQTYLDASDAVMVMAFDGPQLVGVSTGLPMAQETDEFRRPFETAGYKTRDVFYCGETVLDPAFRGRGLYRQFFDGRESHARRLDMKVCTFCAVVRPDSHPRRPKDYVPLDDVWAHFGYRKAPELHTRFSWKEIGSDHEAENLMQFWVKELKGPAP